MEYLHKKEIEIPIYRGLFVIILTNSYNKLKKKIPDFKSDGKNVYAHACNINWGGKQGFVVIFNFDNDFRKIYNGTIAHEAYHACNFLAYERGFSPDFDNDEHMAYICEWMVDQIHSFAKKHNKKPIS